MFGLPWTGNAGNGSGNATPSVSPQGGFGSFLSQLLAQYRGGQPGMAYPGGSSSFDERGPSSLWGNAIPIAGAVGGGMMQAPTAGQMSDPNSGYKSDMPGVGTDAQNLGLTQLQGVAGGMAGNQDPYASMAKMGQTAAQAPPTGQDPNSSNNYGLMQALMARKG